MTSSKSRSRKVISLAHALVKQRGHGALRRAEGELSYNRGYLSSLKTSGDARMSVVFDLAEYLGVPAWLLIKEATGRKEVDTGLDAWLHAPTEEPRIVRLVHRALAGEPSVAAVSAEQLDELDEERYSDPKRALNQLEGLSRDADAESAVPLLGVAASCYRLMFGLREAAACIVAGRALAEETRRWRALGDLHQRATYILAAAGLMSCAEYEAERASLLFVRLADRGKIGESLIDQAYCKAKFKRFDESYRLYRAAESYLDHLPLRYRVACFQGSGATLARMGRTVEACRYLALATTAARDSHNPLLVGKVVWLRGVILTGEDIHAGVTALQEAIDILSPAHPIDAVLAAVDLARAFARCGRLDEAYAAAKKMRGFVLREPLVKMEAAQQALRDLISIGEAARGLSMERLDLVARAVIEGRTAYLRSQMGRRNRQAR